MLPGSQAKDVTEDEVDISIDLSAYTSAPPSTYKSKTTFVISFYVVTVAPRTWPLKLIFGQRNWWDEIVPGMLLGAIPLADWGHLKALSELPRPLKRVVTCCTHQELKGNGLAHTPVSPFHWQELGILQDHLNMKDFTGDLCENEENLTTDAAKLKSLKRIHQAVLNCQKTIDQEGTNYIHCKAGRGRSVLVVLCYLIYFYEMHPQDAIAFVQSKRHEISLSADQIQYSFDYCERYKPEILISRKAEERALVAYNHAQSHSQPHTWWHSMLNPVFWFRLHRAGPSAELNIDQFIIIAPELMRHLNRIPREMAPIPLPTLASTQNRLLLMTAEERKEETQEDIQTDASSTGIEIDFSKLTLDDSASPKIKKV